MSGRSGKIGLFRFSSKNDWNIVWSSMGLVGMIDFARRPVGKLSGGEFQKILLARALAQQPRILLLDEPFSNLDISSRRQMETLLSRLHEKEDITIIMVSHDLSFVPARCNRIVVLDKGKIILDGKKQRIMKSEIIEEIFKNKRGKK
jgi:ABC-type Mn2+/Zn2+ transport system ATPase subunit